LQGWVLETTKPFRFKSERLHHRLLLNVLADVGCVAEMDRLHNTMPNCTSVTLPSSTTSTTRLQREAS
jgi:hypothetical protein